MICLHCDNEQFVVDEAPVRQEFREETLVVRTPVLKCTNCGWHTVGNNQIDELRKRTGDAYRKKHGLLTSEEIKAFRKLLRKTQREFAAFLGVGEASVKRWETWLVQEKGYDNLIRMKCEKALLDKLAQKSVPNVWFSYQAPLTEGACGIAIQTEPPKPSIPSRWDFAMELATPEPQQMMSFYHAPGADVSGLSPPDSGPEGAFSSSALSPGQFQAEGAEEENAAQLQHKQTFLQIADHVNIASIVAFAA